MADFCKRCSIENFGEDFGDLKGIGARPLTKEEKAAGMGWKALCESCGLVIVNDDGECISESCELHGKKVESP